MPYVDLVYGMSGPSAASRARIAAPGGDIGRAAGNAVVLADGGNTVSRVHARIVFRAGIARVISLGAAGIVVDGQWLDQGEEAPIAGGTRIEIGPYLLRVGSAAAS